jgi:hypothetical protein
MEKKRKPNTSKGSVSSNDDTLEIGIPGIMTAQKDFEIHHNEYHRVIKCGDDLSDIPELYHPNLKAEGVI